MEDQNKKVIIGYSGGADSTCLLHWSLSQNYNIIAAHLHHGIREEADLDVEHCQKICKDLNLPLEVERAHIPILAKEKKMSIEEAAREYRYSFLESIRQRHQAEWIFVGHTQDDHLETMIFQIVRGSGLRGLRGLPRQNRRIKRPLWDWTRAQTECYCNQYNLSYLNDSMNQDIKYSRVRIRKTVLPLLLEVHPGARKSLLKLSQIAYEEDSFLDDLAYSFIVKSEKKRRFNYERRFWRKMLLEISPVLLKRGLRYIAREWDIGLDFLLTEKIVAGIVSGIKGGINTEHSNLSVYWDNEQIKFRKNELG